MSKKAIAMAVAVVAVATAAVPLTMVLMFGGGGGSAVAAGCGAAPAAAADGSPSILGPSTLTVAPIVVWYQNVRHGPDPAVTVRTDLATLVGYYLYGGAAEGVRGDIAFAQALEETANFTSSDAEQLNNFAGIGHDNNAASGQGFADVATGVIAQLQLLKEVATGSNAGPFAGPKVAPDWAGRPSPTWAGLAGNWATATDYWTVIAGIYTSMLGQAGAGGATPVSAPARAAGCAPGSAGGLPGGGSLAPMWAFVEAQLGKPYQWGGAGPDSWDCSGLTMAGYAQVGVTLAHNAAMQYAETAAAPVPLSAVQPGDLVFYAYSADPASIHHVGIYVGDNQFLDAPNTGSVVRVETLWPGALGATRPAALASRPAAAGQ